MKRMEFDAEPLRVDVFLAQKTNLTRSAVKRIALEGHVFVDGKPQKAGETLKMGQKVAIEIPDPKPLEARAEAIPLDIVYEDEELAVVNKPQGMTVHAGCGNVEGTLVNALLFHLKHLSGIGGTLRPGIVHRIDKDTSGLLVVAKTDRAHLSLSEQIQNKTCKREYLALVEGVLKEESGTVQTQIGRNPQNRLQMAVLPKDKGRRAVTCFCVEERFLKNTLVRFSLQTGRTHQIRVHCKYLGHPIVGDKLYGYQKQRFALSGQLLHAFRLEFFHPKTQEKLTFSAPLPDYFESVLQILRAERDNRHHENFD